MTKRTAAEMLRELRAVRWEFDVLAEPMRCACRRDLVAGDTIASEVRTGKLGGCLHMWNCIPCATKARVEWARVVADLEWRVEREEQASWRLVSDVEPA